MPKSSVLSSPWFRKTVALTIAAVILTFVPIAPLAIVGGLALTMVLPGVQLLHWLDLFRQQWDFRAVVLSIALGMVTSPILIYWSSLLFGFSRWPLLVVFSVYAIALAAWVSRNDSYITNNGNESDTSDEPADSSRRNWLLVALLIGVTALGVFLAYFELETAQGYYPVQMEDWQKHYGVAFALRYTGIPPTSMFFYGMFPQEKLVYYYFLHLNGATLDLLQNGQPALQLTFVTVIVLASLIFSGVFLLLAQATLRNQKAAVWSLAFATVIGGLDVIPTLHRTIQKYREHFPTDPLTIGVFLPREHIDNWVSALSLRLNTFFAHHIWVPQHLTGLTILCLGCYLYLTLKNRRKLLMMLPLLLFALVGHSTWIAVVTLGCLFLFALLQIGMTARVQGLAATRTLFLGYVIIALIFTAVAAPFLLCLIGPQAPKSGLVFEIPKLDSWSILRPFQASFGPTIWARLLDLPLHFVLEMGALLVAGTTGLLLFWRSQLNRNQHPTSPECQPPAFRPPPSSPLPPPFSLLPFWTLLLITGVLTVSLFASGRGWAELGLMLNNDLGLRAIMPGQLVLALFAGYFMVRLPTLPLPRWGRTLLMGIVGLLIAGGVAYAGWEFISMGLTKYFDQPKLAPDVVQTLRALPEVTYPQDKPFPVVQHRLHRDASRFQLSLGNRPVGFSTGEAVVFHRDLPSLALALELSQQAFDNGLPVWSYQMFRNLGADYIFVGPAERETIRHPEKYEHSLYFQQVYQQGDFEIYQVKPPLYQPGQASFDRDTVEFEGYFIDLAPVFPGEPSTLGETPGLVTAWRLTRSVDKNYTLFVHLVDTDGNIIAQADHQLWAWDVRSEGPTTTWTPRLVHLDIVPVPETALAAEESLTIRLGLWLPETGEHFPVDTSTLEIDAGGRLMVGELKR
ncbi:MAG: hypothetical protein JXM69_05830 [Anaerolineae bacterium]|nr:hypothetical protein [Anaerolineae bacterium]